MSEGQVHVTYAESRLVGIWRDLFGRGEVTADSEWSGFAGLPYRAAALLFDRDGVLIDSAQLVLEHRRRFAE